jgi:hypothetical protein
MLYQSWPRAQRDILEHRGSGGVPSQTTAQTGISDRDQNISEVPENIGSIEMMNHCRT